MLPRSLISYEYIYVVSMSTVTMGAGVVLLTAQVWGGWSMGWFITENGHGNLQNLKFRTSSGRNEITDCLL